MARVPARLTWNRAEEDLWRAPDLLVSQTCGYPLVKGVTGPVRLVAAPTYAAPWCEGIQYRSLIVVAKGSAVTGVDQLFGRVCAVNKPISHSGYNALRRLIADYVHQRRHADGAVAGRAGGEAFFRAVRVTGSHVKSMEAVARGKADVAAIDAVTYHLVERGNPELTTALRVLTATLPAPGLPLITAHWRPDDELRVLRQALADCLADPALKPALAALRISGFQVPSEDTYAPILEMERRAEDLGYPVVR